MKEEWNVLWTLSNLLSFSLNHLDSFRRERLCVCVESSRECDQSMFSGWMGGWLDRSVVIVFSVLPCLLIDSRQSKVLDNQTKKMTGGGEGTDLDSMSNWRTSSEEAVEIRARNEKKASKWTHAKNCEEIRPLSCCPSGQDQKMSGFSRLLLQGFVTLLGGKKEEEEKVSCLSMGVKKKKKEKRNATRINESIHYYM